MIKQGESKRGSHFFGDFNTAAFVVGVFSSSLTLCGGRKERGEEEEKTCLWSTSKWTKMNVHPDQKRWIHHLANPQSEYCLFFPLLPLLSPPLWRYYGGYVLMGPLPLLLSLMRK